MRQNDVYILYDAELWSNTAYRTRNADMVSNMFKALRDQNELRAIQKRREDENNTYYMEMRSGLDEDGEFDDDSQMEGDGPEDSHDEGALISCTFDMDLLDTSGIDFDEISEQLLALHRESGIEGFGPEEDEDEEHDDHYTDEGQRMEMSHADLSALLPASFARDDKISAFTNVVHSFGCTPPRSSLSINDLT